MIQGNQLKKRVGLLRLLSTKNGIVLLKMFLPQASECSPPILPSIIILDILHLKRTTLKNGAKRVFLHSLRGNN